MLNKKLNGVFYTPDDIAGFIVKSTLGELLSKKPKLLEDVKLLDPACGQGVFLLQALKYLHKINKSLNSINSLFGIDLDDEAVKVCRKKIDRLSGELGCGTLKFSGKRNIIPGNTLDPEGAIKNSHEMSEIVKRGGFDIIVGNPPYISHGLRGTSSIDYHIKKIIMKNYPAAFQYKISIYSAFIERSVNLLKEGGYLGFIIPDSFLLGRFYSKLRKLILEKCLIKEILVFPKDFWKGASVGFPVILILEKGVNNNNFVKCSFINYHGQSPWYPQELPRRLAPCNDHTKSLRASLFCGMTPRSKTAGYSDRKIKNSKELSIKKTRSFLLPQEDFNNNPYNRFRLFFNKEDYDFVKAMEKNSLPLGKVVSISSGLIGKKGKKSIVSKTRKNSDYLPGLVSGSEIEPFSVKYSGNFISYKKELLKSGYRDAEYFEKKIFIRQTGDRLISALDESNLLCLNNLHVGNLKDKTYNLEFIVSLLNSEIMNRYYKLITLETGRIFAQTDIETLEALPLCKIKGKKKYYDEITELAKKIMKFKAAQKSVIKEDKLKDLNDKINYPAARIGFCHSERRVPARRGGRESQPEILRDAQDDCRVFDRKINKLFARLYPH